MCPIKKGDFTEMQNSGSQSIDEEHDDQEEMDEEVEAPKVRNNNDDEEDEEDEDDEEENPEEMGDFIVNDEEVDEDDEPMPILDDFGGDDEPRDDEEHEIKKKKHKKRRKDYDLDEEDLELLQENEQRPSHSRLKKTKEMSNVYDDDEIDREAQSPEEEGNFIEGRDEEEDDRRKRRSVKHGENYSVFHSIFGTNAAEEEEEDYDGYKRDEEDDMPEEDKRILLKKKYDQLFDPAELQDKFATYDDEQIIAEDIPERLQLRYKEQNKYCENSELVQETNWIADRLIVSKGLIDKNSENFRKNIMKVLEFLRISFYEIMYIHTYKANEISLKPGELKLQDLWKIYDLDSDWTRIWGRRKLLKISFEKLASFYPIPALTQQLATLSFDKFNLDNLLDYYEFQMLLHPEMNELNANPNSDFKKAVRTYIKPELKVRFDDFTKNHLLSSESLAENLSEGKIINAPPYIEELMTELTHKRYVDENIPKLSNPELFLNQLCDYVAHDLFYNPIIRKVVYRQYFEKILLSTEPTTKGRKELDIYNISYSVKRIDGRPLKDLEDEIWLRAVQNEKEGKIKIKFHFRWKDFNSDEIFVLLKNFYLYDSKIKNEATSQWNILRTEILTILLKNLMYPYMEKIVRQDLNENAERAIIQECGKKFKEMINAAPYAKSDGDDIVSDIRVMSLIPDENNKVTCVIVDKYGEYMDHKTFSYLLINERRAPVEYITKQSLEETDLKHFVEKFTPDLLVVGADNLSAKSLVKYLRDQSQKWNDECKNVWIKYGDMTASKIYAKMEVSKKELPDHPVKLKEAISLARLQQSPLHEILKLWHYRKEENGISYMIFHDLQSYVNQDKLLQELEKAAIEVTNQVGIEINKVIRHSHLSHPFQFICGLGPRKAKNILDILDQKMMRLTSRRELTEEKLVGKNVFTNMAGFIKVVANEGKDLLDATRIHPNGDYRHAQKIARDALDDGDQSEDSIKAIMDKPRKLDDLDLDDYAAHLEAKGKQNMKIVLDFIVNELTRPFADPRGAHREMDHKELFYKMTKMHPFDLQNGSLVNAKVIRVTEKNIICRLECGIEGNVFIQEVFEGKESQTSLPKKFHEGQIVTARVVGTNFDEKSRRKDDNNENKTIDFTKLHLFLKPSVVTNHVKFLKDLHPSTANTFKTVPEEDFPVTQSGIPKPMRYYTRKINHPKFKNTSGQGALSYLEDKEIGDYVVRPSSKSMDHLTLTWKFYDNIFVHLDIKESAKGPSDRIGRRLHLKDQIYESIDELAAGYVYACNSFVKNILSNHKFCNDNPARIEEIIKQEKEESPKLIPYRFGFTIEAPQHVILYYAPKDYNVTKEYIKVRPNGLFFHDKVFQNLSQLISWFKLSYHKPEYHKYLKHAKPPVALPRANAQIKGEKPEPSIQGVATPSNQGGDIRVKAEKDRDIYVKQEKGINVKEEENRGGYNDFGNSHGRDRNFNRQDRGAPAMGGGGPRGYQGDPDRNRSRDFNRDRNQRRDRSRSRDREKERIRDYRGGDNRGGDNRGGDNRGGDRNKDRYNNNRDGGRDRNYSNDFNNRRNPSNNRYGGDRNDNPRRGSDDRRREGGPAGGWSNTKESPGGGGGWNAKTSPGGWAKASPGGWGGNAQDEAPVAESGWAAEDSGWGNQSAQGGDSLGNNQSMNVKAEWKPAAQENGEKPLDMGGISKVKVEPSKIKEEGAWGDSNAAPGGKD